KPQPFFFHVYELVFALAGVLFCEQQRVFGAEVDMRVKAGDSITLYGDCVIPLGSLIVWLRNCSHEYQPSLFIDSSEILREKFPRFHFVPNSSRNSYDLHITNVSVSDEGVYYCAKREKPVSPGSERFNTSSTPPVSDCVLCWTLLFSVCPVCVLLFSICVYCFCQRKTTGDHSLLNSIPSQL
uniref:Immunoglobulin V-set domain-containing protein n=1 Tax=Cyprinus carpio TaxID=7962 RepID=A0A8C1QZ55_CYPCA